MTPSSVCIIMIIVCESFEFILKRVVYNKRIHFAFENDARPRTSYRIDESTSNIFSSPPHHHPFYARPYTLYRRILSSQPASLQHTPPYQIFLVSPHTHIHVGLFISYIHVWFGVQFNCVY